MSQPTDLPPLVQSWAEARPEAIAHVLSLPATTGQTVDWPTWLAHDAIARWQGIGIERPWRHQVHAADLARGGRHVVLATGTASGKSLAYSMPIVAAIADDQASPLADPCALYLAPTKALAGDQLRAWQKGALPGVRPALVDGDTNADDRAWARKHANVILTNPDMLHFSLLPGHARWSRLFRNLRYVVVDEAHAYRGVFGAHVALVLRRLLRIAAHHRSSPIVIAASATTGAPERTMSTLIGADVMAVTEDSSPHPDRTIVLWQPQPDSAGDDVSPTRDAALLTESAITAGGQVLTFLRSRRATEYVAGMIRDDLNATEETIAAYRGGYLAEERRALEAGLREGRIRCLATTNALELGIDISGVDAVVTAGWPGTRASLWQQFGRAGRAGTPALGVFVAREDPLDSYIVEHPEILTDSPVEETVFDPANPRILAPHLCAAAAEVPITDPERWFPDNSPAVLDELTESGLLRHRPTGWYWTARERPHDLTDLRGSGDTVRIVEVETGRLLGTIDESSAHRHVHPGAVYVHQGITHVVADLDLSASVAMVIREQVDYTTFARDISDIRITGIDQLWSGAGITMHLGEVDVISRTVAYERKALDGTSLGIVDLDLPERVLSTQAIWWTISDQQVQEANIDDLPGAVHAAEHAAIGLLPLFASCDRWDIGGVSTERHPDTALTTIFIYDGVPGGAGFTERGSRVAHQWLSATRQAISACKCSTGCPNCIQSPKCGNGNEPLSRPGALQVLDLLIAGVGDQ